MAAMKSIAIEAERQQECAGDGTAFRLGMLYAVSQLTDLARSQISSDDGMTDEAFEFYSDATRWLFSLHDYLMTNAHAQEE
jgi:hypothetical protein